MNKSTKQYLFIGVIGFLVGVVLVNLLSVKDEVYYPAEETHVYKAIHTDSFHVMARPSIMEPGVMVLTVQSQIPFQLLDSYTSKATHVCREYELCWGNFLPREDPETFYFYSTIARLRIGDSKETYLIGL